MDRWRRCDWRWFRDWWRRDWWWLLAWIAVIFVGSGLTELSGKNLTDTLHGFFHGFFPGLGRHAIERGQFWVRKGFHFAEFFVLAILLFRVLDRRLARRSIALVLAGLGAVLLAAADEWHQGWVPGRQPAVVDVLIDGAGIGLGLLAAVLAGRWRRAREGRGRY